MLRRRRYDDDEDLVPDLWQPREQEARFNPSSKLSFCHAWKRSYENPYHSEQLDPKLVGLAFVGRPKGPENWPPTFKAQQELSVARN